MTGSGVIRHLGDKRGGSRSAPYVLISKCAQAHADQSRLAERHDNHSCDFAPRPSFRASRLFLPSVGHSAASSKPYLRPSAMPCAIILTTISASSLESRLRDVHEFRIRRARAKSVSKKSGIKSGLIGIFAILQPRLIYHSLNGARYAFETPKEGFSYAKCIPYTGGNSLAGGQITRLFEVAARKHGQNRYICSR